ncbi:hypothetical protein QJS10_CPA01g01495 [Acorus calamus]|uniref:Uncharacterized protein n=1 Tax=Acorus calamus TaxID=4465 RepID=A0AAV9FG66_ACOCL|nr:hypothetical protein QJS10_CPA01g01495 [Acorus calamus]
MRVYAMLNANRVADGVGTTTRHHMPSAFARIESIKGNAILWMALRREKERLL